MLCVTLKCVSEHIEIRYNVSFNGTSHQLEKIAPCKGAKRRLLHIIGEDRRPPALFVGCLIKLTRCI